MPAEAGEPIVVVGPRRVRDAERAAHQAAAAMAVSLLVALANQRGGSASDVESICAAW